MISLEIAPQCLIILLGVFGFKYMYKFQDTEELMINPRTKLVFLSKCANCLFAAIMAIAALSALGILMSTPHSPSDVDFVPESMRNNLPPK